MAGRPPRGCPPRGWTWAAIVALFPLMTMGTPVQAPVPGRLKRLALAGLAALLLQLALGGYVRHAGAGLACPDFPLCSGSLLPHHWESALHWIHRWLGVALLGLFVHLALAARRTALARPAALAAGLAVLQVTLGVAAVLGGLAVSIRAAHAVVAYGPLGVLVWLSVRAECWGAVARGENSVPPEIIRGGARASQG